jgi:hypothetical protein
MTNLLGATSLCDDKLDLAGGSEGWKLAAFNDVNDNRCH